MWSGLLRGDEAYAGAKSYYRFIQACLDVFGYGFFCPVHQGRAAEKVLFPNLLHPGTYALANLFLTPPAAMWCSPVPERWSASARKPSTPSWSPPSRKHGHRAHEQTILEKGPENVGLVVMTLTK
jgi:tryptophanase